MSIRAYRVEQIILKDEPSFNLWHDKELMNWLYNNTDFNTSDSGGMVDIAVIDLEQAIKVKGISDDVLEALVDDIKRAKRMGDEFITYSCF